MMQSSRARAAAPYAVVGALLLAGANAAVAQQARPEMSGAVRQACAADVETLCASVQPGGGRIMQCLKTNAAKVSPGCKDALKEARAAEAGAKPASP